MPVRADMIEKLTGAIIDWERLAKNKNVAGDNK